MTETTNCPVDGCDYSGSVPAVRAHINASKDHPEWSELADQVEGTDQEQSDQPEAEEEQAEADEKQDSESDGEADETDQDMVSDSDIEKQRQKMAADQTDSEDEPRGTAVTTPNKTLLLAGAGLVVAGALLYLWLQSGTESGTPSNSTDQPELSAEETGLLPE